MNGYRVYSNELSHSGRKSSSRYSGGFVKINGRLNNSRAYNSDYYQKNKEKWKLKGRPTGESTGKGTVTGRNPADTYDYTKDSSLSAQDRQFIRTDPDVRQAYADLQDAIQYTKEVQRGSNLYVDTFNRRTGYSTKLASEQYSANSVLNEAQRNYSRAQYNAKQNLNQKYKEKEKQDYDKWVKERGLN